ncbi:TonB-dependent receptor, partial [Pseudomonas sp. CCC2.2]
MNDPQHHFDTVYTTKGVGEPRSIVDNAGLFFGDTLTLNQWWQVMGSLRYDHWTAESTQRGQADTKDSSGAWSGRAGVVFKPQPNGTIYA